VKEVMPLIRIVAPGVPLRVFGSSIPESIMALACNDIIIEGWVADAEEIFGSVRVFVAPLLSGAGIKGKVIDALAFGVPMVLSPVAAEGTEIRNELEAYICDAPSDWADRVSNLLTNDTAWASMSAAAVKFAESQFSFERAVAILSRSLELVSIYRGGSPAAISQ